jgi:TfoX/Sxy family transcriptional regulator of competence genes
VGRVEDELRIDAEDALGGLDGLEVRRMFSGWGFYSCGLLFAAAWDGEFRWRTRQGGRWVYVAVERPMLDRPAELVSRAREVLSTLAREPAAEAARRRPRTRGPDAP